MKPVERCEKMCQRLSWIEAILIIDMNIVERTLRKAFYFARKLWAKYFTSFLPCPAIDMRQNVNGNLVVFTLGIFPQCEARTYDKYMANGRWATKKLIYSVFFLLLLGLVVSFISQFIYYFSLTLLCCFYVHRFVYIFKSLMYTIFFSLSDNFFDLGKVDVYSHSSLFSLHLLLSHCTCNVIMEFNA